MTFPARKGTNGVSTNGVTPPRLICLLHPYLAHTSASRLLSEGQDLQLSRRMQLELSPTRKEPNQKRAQLERSHVYYSAWSCNFRAAAEKGDVYNGVYNSDLSV